MATDGNLLYPQFNCSTTTFSFFVSVVFDHAKPTMKQHPDPNTSTLLVATPPDRRNCTLEGATPSLHQSGSTANCPMVASRLHHRTRLAQTCMRLIHRQRVYWVLCTGYCVLGTVYWVLCTGYCVLGTVYWVLCTGYCVLGT